ncbi:MAG: transglycosylase SLT domain-containing protein [Thermodesulfobacteriota bacterium]
MAIPGIRRLLLAIAVLLTAAVPCPAEEFPLFDCIAPNVAFWKDVYSRYTTGQAILHDATDLSIVYEVMDLGPVGDDIGQANRDSIKEALEKYKAIVQGLAAGRPPATAEERRVRGLFAADLPAARLQAAAGNIRWQRGQADRFREGLIRSGAYLAEMKGIFRSQGLPEDLAYLPHVESSFQIRAGSKAGAAGVWQFTRSTGSRFLRIGSAVDERYDPIRASHAAARLLKENHEALGDWPLALTAYNHGAGGMRRAKAEKGDYPTIFREYNGPLFKFASRNFYSEFLAAREVAKDFRRYFGELRLESPEKGCRELTVPAGLRFADACRRYGVSADTLADLNPALLKPVRDGGRRIPAGYRLRLPAGAKAAGPVLAAAAPEPAKGRPALVYRVRRGDTLSAVARRHNLPAGAILLANNLQSADRIFPGQELRIPAAEGAAKAKAGSSRKGKTAAGGT